MMPGSDLQPNLRRYLLGQLDDQSAEAIEKEFLVQDDAFDELLSAEDELTDDYISESLNAADRTAFETHFLSTPERHEQLKFGRLLTRHLSRQDRLPNLETVTHDDSKRARAEASDTSIVRNRQSSGWWISPRAFFASPWRAVAFAVVLLAVGFGAWYRFIRQSPVDEGLLALNSAYREQRPLESRISNFDYAPYPKTRGPNEQPRFDALARTRAEAILSNEVNERANARAHHALGQVFLANRQFDQAIQQFDEAVKSDLNDPKLYSDLGVAWLEKGRLEAGNDESGKRSLDFGHALANLNKALELDSHSLEATFNKALCLQLMSLPEQAANQWRDYLKLDATSAWAREASHNLKQLEDLKSRSDTRDPIADFLAAYRAGDDESAWRVVRSHRDLSGGPIINALIDDYLARSTQEGSDQALEAFKILAYLAKLEKDRAGDLFVQDLVHDASRLSLAQRKSMMEARGLLRSGQQYLLKASYQMAVDSLNQARDAFQELGCPAEAIYTEYPLGHSFLNQKKSDLSLAAFERVVHASQMHRYKWLMAQALNATANTQIGLTNHSAALEASERSLLLSKEIGDTTGVIKTTNQLASEYSRLGNYGKSLALHEQSLVAADLTPTEPMQYWRNYFSIAMPLEALGLHEAAIAYESEALRRAEAMKQATEISRSYSLLGLMHAGAGDYQTAIENGNSAINIARTISDTGARREAVAYSTLQLALVYRKSGDPEKAIANYDEAMNSYRELDNFAAFSYVANKGKLLACIATPKCTSAEQQIGLCLDLFQHHRANIREVSNKLPFFDTEQDIYDIASEYEFRKGNYQQSFEYSEQARGLMLRELAEHKVTLIGTTSKPDLQVDSVSHVKTFDEIRAALPPEAQVLQYTVLQDKVIIWLISNSKFLHEEKFIAVADLDETITRYVRRVSFPSSTVQDLERDEATLYDLLIRPVAQQLMKDKLLCIVPDKMLNYLPFASLAPAPGEYLIDQFRIVTAPSSTMFITSTADATGKSNVTSETLLSVGDPQFDRSRFPELAELPSAAKEAREIRRFYQQSSRTIALTGPESTKSQVMAQMRQADVVHLAAHSIVDELSPLRSRLILAGTPEKESEGTGMLEAYEIYEAKMPVTRLVVLSACETNGGRYYRGEGVLGLSEAFMAAGVPLVVASLWNVDSDATADLMVEFHRLRKTQNLSTVEALRQSQLLLAHGADTERSRPYYWAGFTVSGGYATF